MIQKDKLWEHKFPTAKTLLKCVVSLFFSQNVVYQKIANVKNM